MAQMPSIRQPCKTAFANWNQWELIGKVCCNVNQYLLSRPILQVGGLGLRKWKVWGGGERDLP